MIPELDRWYHRWERFLPRDAQTEFVAILLSDAKEKLPLTPRQRDVYDFINETITGRRCAPSLEEIATRFGFQSLATVHEHISNLVRKGWIERAEYGVPRSLRVTP